jgi:hypothetical protein
MSEVEGWRAIGVCQNRRETRVSPELALVDPELAAEVRALLPDMGDVLVRVQTLPVHASKAPIGRQSRRLPVSVAASCAVVFVFAAGLLAGLRMESRGTGAGAGSAEVAPAARPDVSKSPLPQSNAQPVRSGQPAERSSRRVGERFAWAPTPGASGYYLEIFRGERRVLELETKKPTATIPARWTYDGARQQLVSGAYRWYVWPMVAGMRAPRAIVQATLTVPRS